MLVSVLAIYFATEPAHEVESGLVDLVLARAVPRRVVVTRSLLVAAGAVIAAVTLMALGTRLGLRMFADPEFDAPSVATSVRMLLHLAAVAACFGGFGLAIAAGARRWSTAFTTAALTLVVLYLIDFLAIGWPPMRAIAWIPSLPLLPGLVDSGWHGSRLAQPGNPDLRVGHPVRRRLLAVQQTRLVAQLLHRE